MADVDWRSTRVLTFSRQSQLFQDNLLQLGQSSATLSGAAVAMQCCPSHAPNCRTNQVRLYLIVAMEGETCKTDFAPFDTIIDIEKFNCKYRVHFL